MYEVMLHDERIKGSTPNWDGVSGFKVLESDPIDRVISWVRACYNSNGQMEELGILGHGYVRVYAPGISFGGNEVKMGNWEGPVYLFSPTGSVTNVTPWAGVN